MTENKKTVANIEEGIIRHEGLILVSCIRNYQGEYKWNSAITGRTGQKFLKTKRAALNHAIRALALKNVEWEG